MKPLRPMAFGSLLIVVALVLAASSYYAQPHPAGLSRIPAERFTNGRPDSALVWGPNTYTRDSSPSWTYTGGTLLIPSFDASKRYFVRITNGDTASGANRVSQVSLTIDGKEFLSASDITTSISAMNRVVQIKQTQSTIQVGVAGATGSFIRVWMYETADPSYDLHVTYGDITVPNGLNLISDSFSKPGNASGPWTVRVENGDGFGSNACTNLKVTLNGVDVVPLGLVNTTNLTALRQVTLQTNNTITLRLYGASGSATVYWAATDTTPPAITLVRPLDGYVTDSATVATTAVVTDQTAPTSVTVDGVAGTITSYSGFTVAKPLTTDGLYTFTVRATDRAGYACSVTRRVVRDTRAPELLAALINPTPTPPLLAVTSDSITVTGAWSDTSITTVTVDGDTVGTDSSGTFSRRMALDLGSNGILIRARDALGHETSFKRFVARVESEGAAIDSTAIGAGTLASTELTPFGASVSFLYSGASPVQTGLGPGALTSGQEAVIHGRVLARDLNPLANVTVRVLGQTQFGETATRNDGQFDLVVNGGPVYTLQFLKLGYLEAQRTLKTIAQDYTVVGDVALVGRSSRSFAVNTTATDLTPIVTRFESDLNGDRKTTLVFAPATQCTIQTATTTSVLTSFHVRAKEFTVGSNGDEAMPAELPPSTAYAFCAELSIEEATALVTAPGGAEPKVTFSNPVSIYVRDVLGLGVGNTIPLGYYDRQQGKWIPEPDGGVVAILSTSGTMATLDTDGDGLADDSTRYVALGISDNERTQLKSYFAPGDTLLRARLSHFSIPDLNPNVAQMDAAQNSPPGFFAWLLSLIDKFLHHTCNCIIENENRVLGESIPIAGTPYSLVYRSSRQPGDLAMRSIRIPITGTTAPPGLSAVHVEVLVAGKRYYYKETRPSILTIPNQSYLFAQWDGKDVFGREVVGATPATVRLGFEFTAKYFSGATGGTSYGNGAAVGSGRRVAARGDRGVGRILWQSMRVSLGAPSMASAGLGGWTISPHHFYDTNGPGVIYFGNGSYWTGSRQFPTRSRFAGSGANSSETPIPPDGAPAVSNFNSAVNPVDMAFGPSGDLYISDAGAQARVIAKVTPGGIYRHIAGHGSAPFSTDGVLATDVRMGSPQGLDIGPDGSVYFVQLPAGASGPPGSWLYRVSPDGRMYQVAGALSGAFTEGMLAKDAPLTTPRAVAVGPDGAIYIGESRRILRIGTDGRIRTYAGNGTISPRPANGVGLLGRADSLALVDIEDLAVDRNGNLFALEATIGRVLKVSPDNQLFAVVSNEVFKPTALAFGPDGSLYVTQNVNGASGVGSGIRAVCRIESDGSLTTAVGGLPPLSNYSGQEGVPAGASTFAEISTIALDGRGNVYVGETQTGNFNGVGVTRYVPELPSPVLGELRVPSEDGREVYVFSVTGKHLRTLDGVTGDLLFEFTYNSGTGALASIRDAVANRTTTITHTGSSIDIQAPFGQVTHLQLDGTGKYLASVSNPNSETFDMSYDGGGLLQTFRNPRHQTATYVYDPTDGRLNSDRDPALPEDKETTLSWAETGTTRVVTKTSPMGRVTKYTIQRLLDGVRRHFTTYPDGTQDVAVDSMSATAPYGEVERSTASSGEVGTTRTARDPRYGWLARVDSVETVRLPRYGASGTIQSVSRTHKVSGTTIQESVALNGRRFYSEYNSLTRMFKRRSPLGKEQTATLDASGRIVSFTQAASLAPTTMTYFPTGHAFEGKLSGITQGGRTWGFAYDSKGRLQSVTDALNRTTSFDYDLADRETTVTMPGGRVVRLGYDANGNLSTLMPPGRPQHGFGYTPVDLVQSYTPPVVSGVPGPATQYTFNHDRQLTHVTRPDGGEVSLAYGTSTGRLDDISTPRGLYQFTYWDTPQPNSSDPSGQLKTATSPDTVTCSYEYDGPLLTQESWSGAVSGTVARRHDIFFRDSLETVNGGQMAQYAYDDDGLLTGVSVSTATLALHRQPLTGLLDSTSVGGGAGRVGSTLSYDSHGELSELGWSRGGTSYFHERIGRDSLGRITRIDETIAGATQTRLYGYDAAGRLASVSESGNPAASRSYEYDDNLPGNGNRTRERDGTGAELAVAGYDAQDRLLHYGGAVYAWTAAGELAQRTRAGDTLATTYDALGNLVSARLSPDILTPLPDPPPPVAGRLIRYRADAQGRRVQRRVDGVAVRGWLYRDALAPVAELDDTGAVTNRYVYGTMEHSPDLLLRADTAFRVITDHLGSVRAVVRLSDGVVVQRLDYDAWGNVTGSYDESYQSLGYAGGLADPDTRLVRFGARDYDPSVGRWTAKDPIGFAGGDENLYAYAGSAPLDVMDPSGLIRDTGEEPRPRARGRHDSWWDIPWSPRGVEEKAREDLERANLPYEWQNAWEHARGGDLAAQKYGPVAATEAAVAREVQDYLCEDQTFYESLRDLWNSLHGATSSPYDENGKPRTSGLIPASHPNEKRHHRWWNQ